MTKFEELIKEFCPNGVEYKSLEKCCNILDNKRKPITKSSRESGDYPYYGANGIQDYVANYLFDGKFVLVGEDGSVITKFGTPVVSWAEGKIWVNNHAHIIEEVDGVLLRYLYHYIQTVDITNLVHGNIPKFTGKDFRAMQIPVPPLVVQREIVRVLDSFTLLSAELTAELTARRKQYEFYRDKLLNFNVEIKIKKLGEIVHNISSGKNKERSPEGKYNVYGSTGVIGKCNNYIFDEDRILIARVGANAGYVHIATGQYDVSDNTLIVDLKNGNNLKFIFYVLQSRKLNQYAKGGGQPLITAGQLKEMQVPIPPLDVQERIVNVLDNFDAICSDLGIGLPAEIEKRQQQYEFYRDKLLTFDLGSTTIYQTDRQTDTLIRLYQYVFGFAYVRLGDMATISRGIRVVKTQLDEKGEYPVYQNSLTPLGYYSEANRKANSTFVISAGAAGEIGFSKVNFWAADDCLCFDNNGFINSRFLYYSLQKQQAIISSRVRRAGVPRLSRSVIENIIISLPPIEEQQRIVDILDRFDKLCNDISAGLPAEIEARQKQYEYFRDKLLQFNQNL